MSECVVAQAVDLYKTISAPRGRIKRSSYNSACDMFIIAHITSYCNILVNVCLVGLPGQISVSIYGCIFYYAIQI